MNQDLNLFNRRRVEKSYSMFKVRRASREDVEYQRWKSPQTPSGPGPSLTDKKPRKGQSVPRPHSALWQNWEQTRRLRHVLVSYPCLFAEHIS